MSRRHRKCNRGTWRHTHECSVSASLSADSPIPTHFAATEPQRSSLLCPTLNSLADVDDFEEDFYDYRSELEGCDDNSFVQAETASPDHDDDFQCPAVDSVCKPELSIDQVAMLDIMVHLDSSGANRGLYNDLIKVLRKHMKLGFDPLRAKSREKFLEDMRRKVHVPDPIRSVVRGRTVYRFPLKDMMQDLLVSSHFDSIDSIHVNRDSFGNVNKFVPRCDQEESEVMSCKWASDTFDQLVDYDPSRDLFLPLILYADKTGFDKLQRYPLEPWMFTYAIFPRSVRENSDAWRHIGFIPPTEGHSEDDDNEEDDFIFDDAGTNDHCKTKSQENIQTYHDYLSAILTDLKDICENKPEMLVNFGGTIERRRLHVCVSIIIGDQKSQDYICGRMCSNHGSSGRVHRGCMCSGIRGGDAVHSSCSSLVNVDVVSELNKVALLSIDSLSDSIRSSIVGTSRMAEDQRDLMLSFVDRSVRTARALLARPYTLHPLRNAFSGVSFGANRHGVFVATAEDHLHSTEAGLIDYINAVAYGFMSDKERSDFEQTIRTGCISHARSSAKKTMPAMKMKHNFTSQSLMTHSERVGCLLNLRLSLDNPECCRIWEKALLRQKTKYVTFPTRKQMSRIESSKSKSSSPKSGKRKRSKQSEEDEDGSVRTKASCFPFRKDMFFATDRKKSNPFPRTNDSMSYIFNHAARHGFEHLLLEDSLDELQADQLCTEMWSIFQPIEHLEDNDVYPREDFIRKLDDNNLRFLFRNVHGSCNECAPSPLQTNCLRRIRRFKQTYDPGRDASRNVTQLFKPISFCHSVPLPLCVNKHWRKKPKISGKGFTGAILSDTKTFILFVEYVLCYHAWCHHSYLLPKDVLSDIDSVDYGTRLVVQYFDTIMYRGDTSTDSDTCKLHSQLHVSRMLEYFGDLMQYNSSTGERGLKDWAKGVSRTARKRGIDAFTEDTTKRVTEAILLKHLSDAVLRDDANSSGSTTHSTDVNMTFTRKRAHFLFDRNSPSDVYWVDVRTDRAGHLVPSSTTTGTIPHEVIDALLTLEPSQDSFEIWCEGQLPDASYVRCFPNYHANQGPWYDWVGVTFNFDDGSNEETYPCKLLALYTDIHQCKKAVVHSVCSKSVSGCEGNFGDSKLIKHYRKEFDPQGYALLRVVPCSDIKWNLMAYENITSSTSELPERTMDRDTQREHTVMVLRPRQEWSQLFIDWTKEIRYRIENETGQRRYRLV